MNINKTRAAIALVSAGGCAWLLTACQGIGFSPATQDQVNERIGEATEAAATGDWARMGGALVLAVSTAYFGSTAMSRTRRSSPAANAQRMKDLRGGEAEFGSEE